MAENSEPASQSSYGKRIINRFAHLLSAQGVEGVVSTAFFLLLAWLDASVYGEVMYGLAAGSVVLKVVQYGLYYPLVADLGSAKDGSVPRIINRVNVIKIGLLVASMVFVVAMALVRNLSFPTASVLFLISLGFGLEAMAETFFAELRVRGMQKIEARIKIVGSLSSYGWGIATAALGAGPLFVGWFKLIAGALELTFSARSYLRSHATTWLSRPDWTLVWEVFRNATVFALIQILGTVYNKTNVFFLESETGVKGVAYYSATYNLVDPVSVLASEQLLGWVIFPVLSGLWWKHREQVGPLVRGTAQWLMVIAFPIMFVLHTQSDLIIGSIYPADYADAVWMQKYLVWTILLSFENNLFSYVMMVVGGVKTLFGFTVVATVLNLVFNVTLVKSFGLTGACLVLVLTKLVMTLLTFIYCQLRFRFFGITDFLFPVGLAVGSVMLYAALLGVAGSVIAALVTLIVYLLLLWKPGLSILGGFPKQGG